MGPDTLAAPRAKLRSRQVKSIVESWSIAATRVPPACRRAVRAAQNAAAGTRNHHAGFTLPELLVTLAVAAILFGMAAPSFADFIRQHRMSTTTSRLVGDLGLARSEAIKRNAGMLVCPRNASGTACATGTNWSGGWLVCIDVDADGSCDTSTSSAPNPVKLSSPVDASLLLAGPSGGMRFRPDGSLAATATLSLTGTWSGSPTGTVQVATSGTLRSY